MHMIIKVYKKIYSLNSFYLIILGIFSPLVISLILVYIDLHYTGLLSSPTDDYDPMQLIIDKPVLLIYALIIGPTIETTIQYVPVKIATFFFTKRKCLAIYLSIFLSALTLALLHKSELIYFLSLGFAGFIWSTLCLIFIRKKSFFAYLYIAFIHFCYNSIVLLIDYYNIL